MFIKREEPLADYTVTERTKEKKIFFSFFSLKLYQFLFSFSPRISVLFSFPLILIAFYVSTSFGNHLVLHSMPSQDV